MIRRTNLALGLTVAAFVAAACASPGATTGPTIAPTQAATSAPVSAAPTTAPASAAPTTAGEVTVEATAVGDAGTILVDGETGLTLYLFTKDVQGSGESVCLDACLVAWPALTVATGETPTGGPGVDAAKLGTITRDDMDELQVTYDGIPLYFFQGDTAPGDLNGVYPEWETVAP